MHCGAKRRSVCVCVCVCTQWCRHRVYVLCKECTSPALHTLSPLQGGALQSRLQRRPLSRSLPLSLSLARSLSLSHTPPPPSPPPSLPPPLSPALSLSAKANKGIHCLREPLVNTLS